MVNETHCKHLGSAAGQAIVGRECTPILGAHVICCLLQGEGIPCNQFVIEWMYHFEGLASAFAEDRWDVQ